MEYMILIYADESAWARLDGKALEAAYAEYVEFSRALEEAGVLRGGSELKPSATATTVRVRGGKVRTTDGPFAETKEQLGGYYLIEARDLDEAVGWAARCPGARDGACEVRPLNAPPG